jgi:uncharacterized peroxidase-related enzyme
MFLNEPNTAEAAAFLEKDCAADGYVMNYQRAWAWRPEVADAFALLRRQLIERTSLKPTEVALLVCTTARVLGDSYCSLAWGTKLAGLRGTGAAAEVLQGKDPSGSSDREVALRQWAEQVVRDPNGTSATQVEALRASGLSDKEIFEATVHIALRLAFSAVNDALGARPDHQLATAAPAEIRATVTYGRPSSD